MNWFGLFKLLEEMGELQQVLGKIGPFPMGDHPDGKGALIFRAEAEIGDVYAALDYFVQANGLNAEAIRDQRDRKYSRFNKWGLTGVIKDLPSAPSWKD